MTSVSKNVQIDKLHGIINKYNNTYHSTIKMKSGDITSSTYHVLSIANKYKDPKFQIGEYVTISKYKNIFGKDYTPNWSEDVFVIKKVKKLFNGYM